MKAKIIIAFILFGLGINVKAQSTVEDILNALAGKKGSFKEVASKVLDVNSSSNAYMLGGKTRQTVQIILPTGTQKWYYRVTVLDIKSNYSYQNNESLFYLLQNNKRFDTYSPMSYGIDFYILGTSGDVASFSKTGNDNFRAYKDYTNTGTNSFISSCSLIQDNLWVGIKNPNSSQGLRVIVEVVAWGYYK
jgi:hypothetical protein